MNFNKVISQVEKLEMARRNESDKYKDMKTKIHKLKKDKRILQEEVAKTFGNSSRLSFKKKHKDQKDDVLT